MKNIKLLVISILLFGCGTASKVNHVDTQMEQKGTVGQETIGLKDGSLVIQKVSPLEDEMKALRSENVDLSKSIAANHDSLISCNDDLADPRLGGNGNVADIARPQTDSESPKSDKVVGLSAEGNLVVVEKQTIEARMAQEKQRHQMLSAANAQVERELRRCEAKMGVARLAAGLPAKRFRSEGHYENEGRWVQTSRAEHSLDEAFEIAKERGYQPVRKPAEE